MKSFQGNTFNLIMQTEQTAQMHLKWQILKRQLTNVKKNGFLYLFLWGETGITVTVQRTLEITHANKLQVLSRMSLLANVFSPF